MLKIENTYYNLMNNTCSKINLEYTADTPKQACKKIQSVFPALKTLIDDYGVEEWNIETLEDLFDILTISFNETIISYQWYRENK